MTGDMKIVGKARTPSYVPFLFIGIAVLAAQTAKAHNDLKSYKEATEEKMETLAARAEKYRSALQAQGPLSISERFAQRITTHPVVLKKRSLAFEDLLQELKATTSEVLSSIEDTANKDLSGYEGLSCARMLYHERDGEAVLASENIVV